MSTERLMPQDYYAAAFDILAEHGHSRLTIAELCTRLGVTKGSFYHHFDGMPGFVEALLDDWVESFRDVIAELSAISDPVAMANRAFEVVPAWNHLAEAELRTWARSDTTVAAAVDRRDQDVTQNQRRSMALFVDDPERVDVLSEIAMCMLIGLQMRGQLDREHLLRIMQETARSLLGIETVLTRQDGRARVRVAEPRGQAGR